MRLEEYLEAVNLDVEVWEGHMMGGKMVFIG